MEEDALASSSGPLLVFASFGGEVETELPGGFGFLGLASTLAGTGVVTHDAGGWQERKLGSRPFAVQQRRELLSCLNIALGIGKLKLCTYKFRNILLLKHAQFNAINAIT